MFAYLLLVLFLIKNSDGTVMPRLHSQYFSSLEECQAGGGKLVEKLEKLGDSAIVLFGECGKVRVVEAKK